MTAEHAGGGGYQLREVTPADGPAIVALVAASPDTGMIRLRPEYRIDPHQAMTAGRDVTGVVAEDTSSGAVIGMGMLTLGEISASGERRPSGTLHTLVVHPDRRRQGIARAVTDWRLDRLRQRSGSDAVPVALIQKSNAGSFANAAHWATQFSREVRGAGIPLRARPPARRSDLRVRPTAPDELDAFVNGLNTFLAAFELWQPETVDHMLAWLDRAPSGKPINRLWAAVDNRGNLVAGLGLTEQRQLSVLRIEAMPTVMRWLNNVVHLVPSSGLLEWVPLGYLWFRDGFADAGRYLFEAARWEARSPGTTLLCAFDPHGPISKVIRTPPWLPGTSLRVAIAVPRHLGDGPISLDL